MIRRIRCHHIGEVGGLSYDHRCASHCLNTGTAGCALADTTIKKIIIYAFPLEAGGSLSL